MASNRAQGKAAIQYTTTHASHKIDTSTAFSTFLDLPLELRLNIYTYLLPPSKSLFINHCTHLSAARLPTPRNQPKTSPLSRYFISRRLLIQWCRSHGLHLPLVCRQLRDEVLSVIRRQNVRVEGHCVDCLGRVMGCLREQGLARPRSPILKEWWVRIATGASRMGGWESNTAYGAMNELKAVVEKWFGGMGLVSPAALRFPDGRRSGSASAGGSGMDEDCRFWYFEGNDGVKRDREFVVEVIRVIGREQKGRKRKRRNRGMIGTHQDVFNDTNDDDEMDIDSNVDVNGDATYNIHHAEDEDEGDVDDNDEDNEDDDDDDDGDDDDDNNDNTNPNINPNGTFNLVFPEAYTHMANVIELERQTKRYDPDAPRDMDRIIGLEGVSQAYMREGDASNWWRESGKLNRQYGRGKGWVVREEIWIGCSFR